MFQNFSELEQEPQSVEQEWSRSLKNVTPLISGGGLIWNSVAILILLNPNLVFLQSFGLFFAIWLIVYFCSFIF